MASKPTLRVAGGRCAADAERNVRGFALRFHAGEGNRDIVGSNSWKSR